LVCGEPRWQTRSSGSVDYSNRVGGRSYLCSKLCSRRVRTMFQFLCRLHELYCSSKHQAYLPIVASSVRASTLHYCCNDKAFAWGPVEREPWKHPHLHVGGLDRVLNPEEEHKKMLAKLHAVEGTKPGAGPPLSSGRSIVQI
jgi:hypothetical protein